ncbi:hypothetical protein BN14_07358 [Rhizoctonia solani AG-1 IB]|uniref:HAT C-terminal dimerisation domain-containing protein n=1 Tax=Thanatephorus cucumeris (strain AG1-IB / isolate 7/3/14) TaxID=1108050 RepID=M5C1M6_THACB|nr:hypothetical protein BN14_07358 [Rhizoctonia solani AG-1 IB]
MPRRLSPVSTSRAPAPLAHPLPRTQFEIETGLPQLTSASKRPPKRRCTAGTAANVAVEATQLELPPTIEATLAAHESFNAHRKLRYHVAMNILPVQASSASSERTFSSSKFTRTPERNRISEEHMEYLQVLKHILHRRCSSHENNQTLNFMGKFADPAGDMATFIP